MTFSPPVFIGMTQPFTWFCEVPTWPKSLFAADIVGGS
jgi:hypothetical protein